MQTLYYTTSNFVRHTGNVVDLSEYRRKLAQMELERSDPQQDEQPAAQQSAPRPRTRRAAARRQAMLLDACASMGIVVMTLTFTLHVLCM